MLSRPCHSGGRQNHPVDYEIMLLQKNKEWKTEKEIERQIERKAEEGKEGMASSPWGTIVRYIDGREGERERGKGEGRERKRNRVK